MEFLFRKDILMSNENVVNEKKYEILNQKCPPRMKKPEIPEPYGSPEYVRLTINDRWLKKQTLYLEKCMELNFLGDEQNRIDKIEKLYEQFNSSLYEVHSTFNKEVDKICKKGETV